MSSVFTLPDLAATEALGRRLGPLLFPGAVVGLTGGLGAGKTHFVRAVAEGLGVRNPAVVTSPTFVLIQEYPARLPVYHFDAYRLHSVTEFLALGTDEYFLADGVCLVEWADRVADALPVERLDLDFRVVSEHAREVRAEATGQRYAGLLAAWSDGNPNGISQVSVSAGGQR